MRTPQGERIPDPQAPPKAPVDERFPAWKYHPTGASTMVNSEEEAAALGEEWTDRPTPAPQQPLPVQAAPMTMQQQFMQPQQPVIQTAQAPQPCLGCQAQAKEIVRLKTTYDRSWKEKSDAHDSLKAHNQVLEGNGALLRDQLSKLSQQNAEMQIQITQLLEENARLQQVPADAPASDAEPNEVAAAATGALHAAHAEAPKPTTKRK